MDAKKVVIILEENTKNYLVDGTSYVFSNIADDEPNAAIFSKADLTICGSGSLSVDANYNDAIASKDGLIIACGIITVDSVDDGIRGKDYIIIKDGVISLNVGGDGLKSDNSQDATAGYISITSGTINITSAGDAMDAETDVMISGGTFTLTTGGGSNSIVAAGTSAKGIKGSVCVIIDAGSFTINSADDAVHSNGIITINEGSFTISTGDDAFHADSKITVNGGDINIIKSFEGIESMVVTINDGRIHLISSDDGINIAGGNDSSGMFQAPGMGGGFDQWGGMFPGIISSSTDHYLYINGGYVVIDALGDGIDSNGAIQMTNGYLIINGPVSNMNGALDYQATSSISGGFLIAVGSSGMAQTLPSSTTQNSILKNFRSIIPADTLINIQSSDGTVICSFTSIRKFQSIALSSAGLTSGVTYNVYINGSTTGTAKDGLYLDGTYTPGTLLGTFTVK